MDLDYNEVRAEELIKKYMFNFNDIDKHEIIKLLELEFQNYCGGSSEYLRVLCGYLFCIGDENDAPLIEKIKYKINMDVGCMIDGEWIKFLKDTNYQSYEYANKNDAINAFITYCTSYFQLQD